MIQKAINLQFLIHSLRDITNTSILVTSFKIGEYNTIYHFVHINTT